MDNKITKELTVLIFDFGNFTYVAQKFAKTFKRVLYYCPYAESFPKYNKYIIGSGIPNVEKVESFWPYFNEIDLWYFGDLYEGEFQDFLRNLGKAVYGAGKAETLELLRDEMKYQQKQLGLELNEYEVIYGVDSLQKYLEDKEDRWVKLNKLRGSKETWHHENIRLSQPIIDEMNHTLGVFKHNQVFIVEAPINNAIEHGFDGFNIEGVYTDKTLYGIEIKDSAYVCTFTDYDKLPKAVKETNKKLAPIFEKYGYRGWWSSEIRSFTKENGILSDATTRNGEPPTSIAIEMLDDYCYYCWLVAIGEVPNLKAKYKYGVQLVIKSDWAKTEPQPLYFPSQYVDYIKIKNLVIQDGIHYFVPIPGTELEEIGAVIGMGNTLKEAITQAKMIAGEVKGYEIKVDARALDEAEEGVKKLSDIGIKIF